MSCRLQLPAWLHLYLLMIAHIVLFVHISCSSSPRTNSKYHHTHKNTYNNNNCTSIPRNTTVITIFVARKTRFVFGLNFQKIQLATCYFLYSHLVVKIRMSTILGKKLIRGILINILLINSLDFRLCLFMCHNFKIININAKLKKIISFFLDFSNLRSN